nr:RNA-directed DNA polymerase, eukaryota [Tanacetum cinerariifolium]
MNMILQSNSKDRILAAQKEVVDEFAGLQRESVVRQLCGLRLGKSSSRLFNHFITSSRLVDVKLEGYFFTWAHHSATKMSKLDRFLVSEGIISLFPSITALSLDHHLSDHRPILLREIHTDYGPISFRFYHSWFKWDGFDVMVEQAWNSFSHSDTNGLIRFKKKLQDLKKIIHKNLNYGTVSDEILLKRMELTRQLHDINQMETRDYVQKSKIKWVIEGDENSKFFHGIINKKRSRLSIRGVFVDGDWNTDPEVVKDVFKDHFATRFKQPAHGRPTSDGLFKGIKIQGSMAISHLVYADDVVFIGEWFDSNLDNIVKFVKCFFLASGLKINIQNSQVLGVGVPRNIVNQAASLIGCADMQNPFRLTLLKLVLGASPLYNMSIYKVPNGALKEMEAIRCNFFNGVDHAERKIAWVSWDKVLASKKNGGLGVSSLHALDRALLLKWVWRFLSQDGSLWYRVIQALYDASFELHPVNQKPWSRK